MRQWASPASSYGNFEDADVNNSVLLWMFSFVQGSTAHVLHSAHRLYSQQEEADTTCKEAACSLLC